MGYSNNSLNDLKWKGSIYLFLEWTVHGKRKGKENNCCIDCFMRFAYLDQHLFSLSAAIVFVLSIPYPHGKCQFNWNHRRRGRPDGNLFVRPAFFPIFYRHFCTVHHIGNPISMGCQTSEKSYLIWSRCSICRYGMQFWEKELFWLNKYSLNKNLSFL